MLIKIDFKCSYIEKGDRQKSLVFQINIANHFLKISMTYIYFSKSLFYYLSVCNCFMLVYAVFV